MKKLQKLVCKVKKTSKSKVVANRWPNADDDADAAFSMCKMCKRKSLCKNHSCKGKKVKTCLNLAILNG